ncbi:helix-turn-helix domain-containing transcriptional regulator [Taklimakanibacter deserti]|uniref:helix-turn-helix domain-containing transcriptional regulator n=1 Tax=Taklimakanibacter deserti TaxID=2267839 RepID=UPI0013C50D1A
MILKRFDASEHLDTPERRVAYISLALETGDIEEIRDALGLVAIALSFNPSSRRKPGSPEKAQPGKRCPRGKNFVDPGFLRDDGIEG